MKLKNPYLTSYMCLAICCCVSLFILFPFINHTSIAQTQREYYQKKTELIVSDFETQLSAFDEIALQISIDSKYQPYYLQENMYNEIVMLEDFEQYSHYSALTDDYFLYYGARKIYLSSGSTTDLDIYLKKLPEDSKKKIIEVLAEVGQEKKILSLEQNLYVLIPLRVYEKSKKVSAVLCCVIPEANLQERFQIVSGGMEGNISLYGDDGLLFCNQSKPCEDGQSDVLTAYTTNGIYKICYLPSRQGFIWTRLLVLQVLSVLMAALMLFLTANMLARRSYGTILDITRTYRSRVKMPEKASYDNALEEINYMMDRLLETNALANEQIKKKQEMLRKQVLHMLLVGNYSHDITAHLDKLQIRFPGRYFFVTSILYDSDEGVTKEFLSQLSEELERISLDEEKESLYTVCDYEKMRISAICSIQEEDQKEELVELVCEMAESFAYEPVFGIGNLYPNLSSLSGSWLESIDNIHQNIAGHPPFFHDADELYRISSSLSKGDEADAMAGLARYIDQLESMQMSILLQQCVFSDFLSEIARVARECQVVLSNQSLSLIVSARSVESFQEAAQNLIKEFCESVQELRSRIENSESRRIYEYVSEHFAEYDLSIEKVASDLGTSVPVVRKALLEHTGKKYKDHIIFLRIEYAKRLLLKGDLTVAEICQQVGYGNLAHFFKLFKEMTGVTPAKYRKGVTENMEEEPSMKE
ncbi:MAG: helix-turn-helix transcriptional regulator [Lachnospiraceae bacterium]|nr:helix-turn-helix domain-containing protein [uncultured Acetatifactor sp.]MCI9230548.1 helix-turn-helix transcriptional regulator [Lachnospiraceae bacterium]